MSLFPLFPLIADKYMLVPLYDEYGAAPVPYPMFPYAEMRSTLASAQARAAEMKILYPWSTNIMMFPSFIGA